MAGRLNFASLLRWRPAAVAAPPPPRPPMKRGLPHIALFAVALLASAALTVPGLGAPGGAVEGGGSGPAPEPAQFELSGASSVGTPESMNVTLDFAGPSRIQAYLTWTDEADQARHQNQPDTLQVTVTFGDQTASADGTNPQGGQGEATAVLELGGAPPAGITEVNVTVEVTDAGPQVGAPRGLGLRDRTDGGNDWTLVVNATYTPASAASGRAVARPNAAEMAHDSEFDPHAYSVALGATLFAGALGSALMLRGVLPPRVLPARLRPTRGRHAVFGAAALGVLGAGAALGTAAAVAGGHTFEPHGILGLVLLVGFSAQGAAGYLTLRGRPTRRLHGLIGSAMAGALLGVAAAGLAFFLA